MSSKPQPDEPSLQSIQHWMQSVIAHPLGIEAGIEADEARQHLPVTLSSLEEVINRSRALTSVERLAIYGNAYSARLLECLRGMFTALVYALGEEAFDGFAFSYLQRYPSKSYSLNHLADHFVTFLRETRPDDSPQRATGAASESAAVALESTPDWTDFVIDLAQLEWTIDQVFDGPGMEKRQPLSPGDLQQIAPEDWPYARLVPSPCLKLLEFKFPVSDYFAAFRAGEEPEIPDPQPTYVAISRRDYIVRRYDLVRPQFILLAALESGQTVGEAIEATAAAVEAAGGDLDSLAASLADWFSAWGEKGFFQAVQ